MRTLALLVEKDGAYLSLSGAHVLALRLANGETSRVGLQALDSVVIHAETQISSSVLRALAAHGVGLTVVSHGREPELCWAQSGPTGVHLRHRQHLAYADPTRRLALAKQVLQSKSSSQLRALDMLGAAPPEILLQARERIDAAETVASLFGIEGTQARAYFACYARAWERGWHFDGSRSRRPPQDPVNALLSLGYTLARGVCCQLLIAEGLDLALGFLHEARPPRAALADDLVESCRSAVDLWARAIALEKVVTPAHFETTTDEGCRLDPSVRRALYANWFADAVPNVTLAARGLLSEVRRMLINEQPLGPRSTHHAQASVVTSSEFTHTETS